MPEDIAAVERRIEEALKASTPLAFGQRLKSIRTRQGISVRSLADRARLSKTSIINLEQGHSCRPVTIMKVCAALGLHIERFLSNEPEPINDVVVHRHEDDRWFDLMGFASGPLGGLDRPLSEPELKHFHDHGIATQMLMFRSRFPSSNFWAGIIELTEASEPRQHPGEEFIFVLTGTLRINVANSSYDLLPGESICFNPNQSHSYAPASDQNEKVSFLCFRMNTPGT